MLAQLRGVPVVGPVWERDVLPLRIEDFDPAWLESLCRSGEVVWWVAGERDPRRARVRFAFRGEGGAFVDPHTEPLPALGADARAVYGLLREEGALFVADLRSALRLDERALDAALVELLLASVVTNDSLAVLRRLVGRPPASTGRRPGTAAASGLEIELSRRLGERGLPAHRGSRRGRAGPGITPYPGVRPHSIHRPPRAVYRATAHRVRDRLAAEEHGEPLVLPPDGRWSLVHRLGIMGPELSPDERALRQARQLLMRHGVVTRASLDREESHWEWPGVYGHLQRMELRGEVRRGYFVRGLPGVQFALPEALERLRSAAAPPDPDDDRELGRGKPVVLNACDPAALWGASRMGDVPAFSRVPSTWLVQQRGLPLVVAEDTAARLIVVPGADPQTLQLAVTALVEHLGRFVRRVTVESWNGELILASEGASLLEPLGFYPDHPRMSWERH